MTNIVDFLLITAHSGIRGRVVLYLEGDTLDSLEELRYALYAVRIPWTSFDVCKAEHEIHSECIRAVLFDIFIRRYDVATRLTHLEAVRS